MIKKTKRWTFILFLVSVTSSYTFAGDKEIIERLTKIDERLTNIEESQKVLTIKVATLEEGQKALNQRIDDVNTRINDLRGVTYAVLGGILALMCGMIALASFVLWDRRTAISPVISKTKELEGKEDITLKIFREYALKEPKMAAVLRSFNLL